MPIYSIIVPVYNVEDYLSECIDSVLAQESEVSYELILVDDGSPDGSGAICDAYAAKHPQIKVIHQKNGGVSAARNAGLDAAQGEYIVFLDGDDMLDCQALAVLDSKSKIKPDMISICTRCFGISQQRIAPAVCADGESGIAYMWRNVKLGGVPVEGICGYVYRREFLEQNHFRLRTDIRVAEDMDFNFSCLEQAKSVVGTTEEIYLYRVHQRSITMNFSAETICQAQNIRAKWFYKYPNAAFANKWCYQWLGLSNAGKHQEVRGAIEDFRKTQDILDAVTGRKEKIARACFRIFGVYHGSAIIQALLRLRHQICGKQ